MRTPEIYMDKKSLECLECPVGMFSTTPHRYPLTSDVYTVEEALHFLPLAPYAGDEGQSRPEELIMDFPEAQHHHAGVCVHVGH